MNFSRGRHRDEPEINFIPLIDLLLVILIFLMVTTTYARFADLRINLPEGGVADGVGKQSSQQVLQIGITAQGTYRIGEKTLNEPGIGPLSEALRVAVAGQLDTTIVVNADALTTHQAVVMLMEAARSAGLNKITFATQVVKE